MIHIMSVIVTAVLSLTKYPDKLFIILISYIFARVELNYVLAYSVASEPRHIAAVAPTC